LYVFVTDTNLVYIWYIFRLDFFFIVRVGITGCVFS